MVSSIYLCNKTFFIILLFHEYTILHKPRPVFAIPNAPFFSQGNMVSLAYTHTFGLCGTNHVVRLKMTFK
jgi:hypothetical protein